MSIFSCGSVTSRLADHLRRQHTDLPKVERSRAIGRSELFKTDTRKRDLFFTRRRNPRNTKVGIAELPCSSRQPPDSYSPSASSCGSENDIGERTYFSGAVLAKGGTKVYFWFIKQFYLWLLTAVGGGRTEEFARQSAQQAQDFFSTTGGKSISFINATTVSKFVEDNERRSGRSRKRATTMLQYVTT